MKRFTMAVAVGLVVCGMVFAGGQGEGAATRPVKISAMLGAPALYEPFVEMFNEDHPNVEVELIPAPATSTIRRDRYVTMFAAQDGSIDIVMTNTVSTAEYASAGWLKSLDDHVDVDLIRSRTFPAFFEAATWDGSLYGIPGTGDALHLYYRKDLLELAGYSTPPATWAELVEQVQAIESDEHYGLVSSWERGNQFVCQFLLFVASNGGNILSEDQSRVVIDSPENVEAFRLMAAMLGDLGVGPRDNLTLTVDEARIIFNEGKAVFNINWDYAWGRYNAPESAIAGNVGVATIPSFAGNDPVSVLGGWNHGVNNFSRNSSTAIEFITFITQPEQALWQVLNSPSTSPNAAAMTNPQYVARNPEFSAVLGRNYEVSVARPVFPEYAEMVEIMSRQMMPALYGEKDPAAALRDAAVAFRSELGLR